MPTAPFHCLSCRPQPPRDTMSPEMKERLRREYYGLGGSPNKVGADSWHRDGVNLLHSISTVSCSLLMPRCWLFPNTAGDGKQLLFVHHSWHLAACGAFQAHRRHLKQPAPRRGSERAGETTAGTRACD